MIIKSYSYLYIVALVLFVFSDSVNAIADDNEKAVKESVSQFYAALNNMFKGDLDLMKDVWSHADDVTYMGPGGGLQVGWDKVQAEWETQAAMKLGGSVQPEDMHIVVGNTIAVTSNYEVGENIDAQGKPVIVKIRATNVLRKEGEKWKFIGHHTDLLPHLEKK